MLVKTINWLASDGAPTFSEALCLCFLGGVLLLIIIRVCRGKEGK